MKTIDYASIVDKIDVISQDAYRIGRIETIRYDPGDWSIPGVVVKCDKEISALIDAGTSKSRVLIKPTNFELRDVLLLGETVADAKEYISPDIETLSNVVNLKDKPVTTSDNVNLGKIESVILNLDSWYVQSFIIKLDKNAHAPLGLKKLMFSKSIGGINTSHVRVVSDSVNLTLSMEEVKNIKEDIE